MSKQGVQTFLIECNRGNSQIDATAPSTNNAKWTTKTDFQFKRGDRVGVEAIMIESIGAGSSQQTIEFSGDNVRIGGKTQDWTDDVVILEFGFYMNNNGTTTLNLPLTFSNNVGGDNGTQLKVNSGEYSSRGTGFDPFQFPGCSVPEGSATDKGDAGYNFSVGANETAYDLFQLLDSNGANIALPNAVGDEIKHIILSNNTDPAVNGITADYPLESVPLPNNYNMEGINLPFTQGMNLVMIDDNGDTINLGTIEDVVADTYQNLNGTDRARITLAQTYSGSVFSQHTFVICSCNNGDDTTKRFGYSYNPTSQTGGRSTYQKGARLGIGLYNHSAYSSASNAASMPLNVMRKRGGSFLWEQTRVWSAVLASQIPQLGNSINTTPTAASPNDGGRQTRTCDTRRFKDNAPYILVSPEYQGPQPTPNGNGMCPKLQPMVAYVIIRASNAFEDVNNLADKFTQAFHAINPLITNEGQKLQKYIDDQEFPFNKQNNVVPFVSQGYFSNAEGVAYPNNWNYTTSALWNRVSPLWLGNLVKCVPANIQNGINYKYQVGGRYYYTPNDDNDYLKIGYKGDWNWCNLIYGNMGLKNFRKCWGGDRFIRVSCWDCNEDGNNTIMKRHRDVPRPIILNNQLPSVDVEAPGSAFNATAFTFKSTRLDPNDLIFTNIEYTEANLDIIQEVFRECEDYQVSNVNAVNGIDAQQAQPFWEWEADIGMADGGKTANNITNAEGLISPLQTNWATQFPVAAGGAQGTAAQGGRSALCPSSTFLGNGGEVDIKNAKDVGRMKVWTRWNDDWDNVNSGNRPNNTYEVDVVGEAYCKVYTNNEFVINPQMSRDRNIGVIAYQYRDENIPQQTHTFCAFAVSRRYEAVSSSVATQKRNATSTWELGFINWGDFFGFSPQYGYDQPAIVPMNTDDIAGQFSLTNHAAAQTIYPNLKWRWNNQNFVWVGANNAEMTFDNENNRFQFKGLFTQTNLSFINASLNAAGTTEPATPQIGENIATLNNDQRDDLGYMNVNPTNLPTQYDRKNQGVQDATCGVYLNNVYFAPKGWKPPQDINPQNVYNPYSSYDEDNDDYKNYLNKTTQNRERFLQPLTKATRENWTGNLLDKMGFDYYQIKPPYGSQDNRYSEFTYGSDNIEIMYQGKKPFMLNAETDVAADLDINIFSNNANIQIAYPTPPPADSDGTPMFLNKLLNNQPVNLGDTGSAVLTANRIPTLFACPFYIVLSDICPTEFQSGAFKQECIFYGLKNYGAGQYFYVFGSNYTQLVDTDRTITQVNTEIRNPLTGRLARLSKNSCIIYKVERDIALPPPMVDVNGNPIQQAPTQSQEEMEELIEIKNAIISSHGGGVAGGQRIPVGVKYEDGQERVGMIIERGLPLIRQGEELARRHPGEIYGEVQQLAQAERAELEREREALLRQLQEIEAEEQKVEGALGTQPRQPRRLIRQLEELEAQRQAILERDRARTMMPRRLAEQLGVEFRNEPLRAGYLRTRRLAANALFNEYFNSESGRRYLRNTQQTPRQALITLRQVPIGQLPQRARDIVLGESIGQLQRQVRSRQARRGEAARIIQRQVRQRQAPSTNEGGGDAE